MLPKRFSYTASERFALRSRDWAGMFDGVSIAVEQSLVHAPNKWTGDREEEGPKWKNSPSPRKEGRGATTPRHLLRLLDPPIDPASSLEASAVGRLDGAAESEDAPTGVETGSPVASPADPTGSGVGQEAMGSPLQPTPARQRVTVQTAGASAGLGVPSLHLAPPKSAGPSPYNLAGGSSSHRPLQVQVRPSTEQSPRSPRMALWPAPPGSASPYMAGGSPRGTTAPSSRGREGDFGSRFRAESPLFGATTAATPGRRRHRAGRADGGSPTSPVGASLSYLGLSQFAAAAPTSPERQVSPPRFLVQVSSRPAATPPCIMPAWRDLRRTLLPIHVHAPVRAPEACAARRHPARWHIETHRGA